MSDKLLVLKLIALSLYIAKNLLDKIVISREGLHPGLPSELHTLLGAKLVSVISNHFIFWFDEFTSANFLSIYSVSKQLTSLLQSCSELFPMFICIRGLLE